MSSGSSRSMGSRSRSDDLCALEPDNFHNQQRGGEMAASSVMLMCTLVHFCLVGDVGLTPAELRWLQSGVKCCGRNPAAKRRCIQEQQRAKYVKTAKVVARKDMLAQRELMRKCEDEFKRGRAEAVLLRKLNSKAKRQRFSAKQDAAPRQNMCQQPNSIHKQCAGSPNTACAQDPGCASTPSFDTGIEYRFRKRIRRAFKLRAVNVKEKKRGSPTNQKPSLVFSLAPKSNALSAVRNVNDFSLLQVDDIFSPKQFNRHLSHKQWNKLMHAIHGNTTTCALESNGSYAARDVHAASPLQRPEAFSPKQLNRHMSHKQWNKLMHAIHGNTTPSQSVFGDLVNELVTNDTPPYTGDQESDTVQMQPQHDQPHSPEGHDADIPDMRYDSDAEASSGLSMYPHRRDVLASERLVCQFPSCGVGCKHYKSLAKHLTSMHPVTPQQIASNWIGLEANRERTQKSDAQLGDCEIMYVRPCVCDDDSVDESSFYCLMCEKFLTKRRCFTHMTKDHQLDAEMVNGWACVHDAGMLHNSKTTSKYYNTYSNMTRAFDDLALLGAPELSLNNGGIPNVIESAPQPKAQCAPASAERSPARQRESRAEACNALDAPETRPSSSPLAALRRQSKLFDSLVDSIANSAEIDPLNEHELDYMTSTLRLFRDQLERAQQASALARDSQPGRVEPPSSEQSALGSRAPSHDARPHQSLRQSQRPQPQPQQQQQPQQPPPQPQHHQQRQQQAHQRAQQETLSQSAPGQQTQTGSHNARAQEVAEQRPSAATGESSSSGRLRLLLQAKPKPQPTRSVTPAAQTSGVAGHDLSADVLSGEYGSTQQAQHLTNVDVNDAAASAASVGAQSSGAIQTPKRQRWSTQLPSVNISSKYLELEGPSPSNAGGRISPWPIKFSQDTFVPSGLNRFLTSLKQVSGDQLSDTRRGVARFYNMLEIDGVTLESSPALDDPGVLVAFYMSDLHHELFQMEILNPGHPWTSKFISALKVLCDFHISGINKEQLVSNDRGLGKHRVAIEQLLLELKAGFTKRVKIAKDKSLIERKGIDRKRIQTFAIDVFKEAVVKAMIVLKFIHATYSKATRMPNHIIAEATTCIVGILALNGYFGRKLEWEILTFEHVKEQFDQCLDFIICSVHKTSTTYGDLAKWFAPGSVIAAMRYMQLPRSPHVLTFFCPAFASTRRVSVPTYLRRFSEVYLPGCEVFPTVNLLRKWYHTVLNNMVSDKARLQALFQTIDPHRGATQEKHYVLTGPEDDARLAKQMVAAMMGDTVPWPSQDALTSESSVVVAFEERIQDKRTWMSGASERDETYSEAEGEDELEWFEFAQYFGIPNPCPAVQDAAPGSPQSSSSQDSMTRNLDAALRQPIGKGSQLVAIDESSGAQPAEQLKRQQLGDRQDQPNAKRGRQSKFSEQEKDWVAFHCIDFLTFTSWEAGHAPPAVFLKELIDKGKLHGLFEGPVTVDQIRHICRSWKPATLKNRITVYQIEKPAAGQPVAFVPIGDELVLEAYGYATLKAVLKIIASDIGRCEGEVGNFEVYSLCDSSGEVELNRVELPTLACCHGAIAFHT